MKTCTHCHTTNPDEAKFCLNCGSTIASEIAALQQIPPTLPPNPSLLSTVQGNGSGVFHASFFSPVQQTHPPSATYRVHHKQHKADIMFVLDCTGSMQGEIDAVRDAILHFVESIEAEEVRARVGLIEFRDRLIHEEHRVLQFDEQPFTRDPALFRQQIAFLKAQGGGDEPESSLDAVMLALQQPFDPEAKKVIVLVTDAPPHIPDQTTQTLEEVIHRMQAVKLDQMYIVMRTQDRRNQVYLKLLEVTRGMAFDIGKGDDFRSRAEDFKRTLMALGKTISAATLG